MFRIPAILLLCTVVAVLSFRDGGATTVAGPLDHEVYVWQRDWTPELGDSLSEAGAVVEGVNVLAAEVGVERGRPSWTTVGIRAEFLRLAGRPVTASVRLGSGFLTDRAAEGRVDWLVARCLDLLEGLRAAGIEPAGLQIDCDCPTSRLADYADWLRALRAAAGDTRLSITTLPTWLGSAEFDDLVAEVDFFVLQVHALEKPRRREDPMTLCDTGRALRWIDRAAGFGVPFQLALPTYSLEVGFDGDGAFVGLGAERRVDWGPSVTVKRLDPETRALAALIARLEQARPPELVGLIWFRLPVQGDRLNWPMVTWRRVLAGGIPRPSIQVHVLEDGAVARDVVIENSGTAPLPLDAPVNLQMEPARIADVDGLGGFRAVPVAGGVEFHPGPRSRRHLAPGERLVIGWLAVGS